MSLSAFMHHTGTPRKATNGAPASNLETTKALKRRRKGPDIWCNVPYNGDLGWILRDELRSHRKEIWTKKGVVS